MISWLVFFSLEWKDFQIQEMGTDEHIQCKVTMICFLSEQDRC